MASGGRPAFVAALVGDRGVEVLSWGGDDANGFVEWLSPADSRHHAEPHSFVVDGPVRHCRRWRTAGGERLSDQRALSELQIEASDGAAWRDLMRDSSIEFEARVRALAPKRR